MNSRIMVVWALLVAATLLSFETMAIGNARIGGGLILLIAFAKVLLVGREFMELRLAPPPLLWLFQGWAAATGTILFVLLNF